MTTSWHSYPKIYNLGHKEIDDLLSGDVLVEEKVDGSQFSFGVFVGAIKRKTTSGLPEWYKEQLLKKAFENQPTTTRS